MTSKLRFKTVGGYFGCALILTTSLEMHDVIVSGNIRFRSGKDHSF